MTDSLKVTLDLSKVQAEQLKHIPAPHVYRVDRNKASPIIPFAAKQSWKSPLTQNKMQIKVKVNHNGVPIALNADINIPNATVGQNAELGHSVYAASSTALGLFKLFLAEHGVTREFIDLLTIKDLELQSATITYLVPKHETQTAQECIAVIERRLTQFFPLSDDHRYGGSSVGSKDSKTSYVKMRGWSVRIYSTPPSKIPENGNIELRKNRIDSAQNLIRIELTLTSEELTKLRLKNVSAWECAHEMGTYKILFDTYIRNKCFRLDERLRQDKPDAADLNKLSKTIRHIVEGYLQGKSLTNCIILNKSSEIANQKAFSAARLKILKQLRIDININWNDHRNLGTNWMNKIIMYPGDYHPPADHVTDSFCLGNFESITQRIKITLDETIKRKNQNLTKMNFPVHDLQEFID